MTTVRVDWPNVVAQLCARGQTVPGIAAKLQVARTTVLAWRDIDTEPRHDVGERLIALWCSSTGLPRTAIPMRKRILSAAAMR